MKQHLKVTFPGQSVQNKSEGWAEAPSGPCKKKWGATRIWYQGTPTGNITIWTEEHRARLLSSENQSGLRESKPWSLLWSEEFNIETGSYTTVGRDGEARSGMGNWRFGTEPGPAESEFAGNLEVKHIQLLCGDWERKRAISALRLTAVSP